MNETQEKKTVDIEDVSKESDLDNFYRGTYRRGARRKTIGNFTLFFVVTLMVVIVVTGIVFAIKTFIPVNRKAPNIEKPVSTPEAEGVIASGFSGIIEKHTLLDEENLLYESEEEFVFLDGILNHCQLDLDGDGEDELITVNASNGEIPEFSVYEEQESSIIRNAYYFCAENPVSKDENAKTEIYISDTDEKKYICVEKYCFDDFSWKIEILNYNGGFERLERHRMSSAEQLDEAVKEKLKGYGIEYTISDYSEASELKMNGDSEEDKILLCSFETKDGELVANVG